MSFDTPAGTRGRRQPGGMVKWVNKWVSGQVRRTGRTMGRQALVLTTVGRKSGAERQTPLGWFPETDDSWLIVAAAAGAARNPAWYYNLAAHPDRVSVDIAGQKTAVCAEQLHGSDRAEAWRRITAAAPTFAKYQEATDRELPVIRLRRRPA
jgi:deazaflavin-dependent oxidoreductase (nitroreductase family)